MSSCPFVNSVNSSNTLRYVFFCALPTIHVYMYITWKKLFYVEMSGDDLILSPNNTRIVLLKSTFVRFQQMFGILEAALGHKE